MLLSNISKLINCKKIYNLKKNNLSFNHISTNSKNIEKNSLLIIENNKLFKKEFIIEAIKKGTIAVITSIFIRNIKIPQFITSDTSNSLRILLKHINLTAMQKEDHPNATLLTDETEMNKIVKQDVL